MKLLDEEYPDTNLPHIIRGDSTGLASNQLLEKDHTFVSVAYWLHFNETFPGLFSNLLDRDGQSDALTFAQASVFIPRWRYRCCPWLVPVTDNWGRDAGFALNRDNWPSNWDLFNQNWTTKLVPATSPAVVPIIQTPPPELPTFRSPNLGSADIEDLKRISLH